MHVAVLIVGFRNDEDVVRCVDALALSTYPDFQVTICENGGAEAAARLSRRLPQQLPHGQAVRLIEASDNLGYAGGVNVGIASAPDAQAYWILNPDARPEPEALAALVRRLQVGDRDVVGGVLYGQDQRVQTLGGRWRPWLGRTEALFKGVPLSKLPSASAVEALIDYPSGASMLVSRRFVDNVGPMREDYFLYCEEVEWCLRGKGKNMRIGFAPDARVLHEQGSSTGSAQPVRARPRLPIYLDERNKMLIMRDHHAKRLMLAAPAALALLAARYLRKGAWRQFRYGMGGWVDGLRGKRGQFGCDLS